MISLRDLQRDFLNFTLGDTASRDRPWIVERDLSAEQRLSVYRNNAQMNFAKAMQATFPVLLRLSGEDWFNATTLAYQRALPSRCGDLNLIGDDFGEFLAEGLRGGEHEYFIDVAALEWAHSQALSKREAGPAEFEALDGLADEDWRYLHFVVNPTAQLVGSEFPLFDIWKSNRIGSESSSFIHLNQGPSRILVIRRGDHVEVRELPRVLFALLRSFVGGVTAIQAVDSVIDTVGEFDLADAVARLIQLHALIGFRLDLKGVSDDI